MTLTMTRGRVRGRGKGKGRSKDRSRSRSRNLSGAAAGAGNFKNARLRQPCLRHFIACLLKTRIKSFIFYFSWIIFRSLMCTWSGTGNLGPVTE